jgi:hypothetical protein
MVTATATAANHLTDRVPDRRLQEEEEALPSRNATWLL